MLGSIGVALTGLDAASKKLYASASNISNSDTVGSLDGTGREAYTPIDTQYSAGGQGGVRTEFVNRNPAFVPSFAPGSPFANEDGLVAAPNVNLDEELINSATAAHAYKANAFVIGKSQELADTLLDAFDKDA